jgi:hypothetical protein
MSNSTVNLIRLPYGKGGRDIHLPVAASTHIYEGTLVSQLAATGGLCPGSTALSGPAIGVACHEADNSSGLINALRCVVETDRIFLFANGTSGDACSEATLIGSTVYMGDDHTIYDNSAGGTLRAAGLFMGMETDGKVRVYVSAAMASIGDTPQESLGVNIYSFRECDANGDVGAIAANGGVLASDTTPIMRGDAAESAEISWATGNVDPITTSLMLPKDFDGTKDVTVDLVVYSGTTNAASFVVESGWDGGALVSDTADDASTKSATAHTITATIAAADIPNTASRLTLALTPPTHATDTIQLLGVRVNYSSKSQNP